MKQKIFGTFGLKILLTALSFITSIVLARVLGTDSYGIYTYTNTWILMLGVICGLGFRTLMVREIAVYQANSDDGLIKGLVSWSNIVVALASLVVGIIFAIIVFLFVFDSNPKLAWSFWIVLGMLPFQTLAGLRQGAMQGVNKLIISQTPETIVQPVLFLILVAGCFLFFPEYQNVYLILSLKLLTTIVAFVIGCVLLFKTINSLHKKTIKKKYDYKGWSRSI